MNLDSLGIPPEQIVMGHLAIPPADLSLSGVIDRADFGVATNAIGACSGSSNYLSRADANADGCIDLADLALLFPEDSDHDGLRDWEEFVAGTDPFDAGSTLRVTIRFEPHEGVLLTWPSVAGRTYSVLRSVRLPWNGTTLQTNVDSTPPLNVFRDSSATNQQSIFYKLIVR
jgi:hypothetical protein